MTSPSPLPVPWADGTCVVVENKFCMFGGYSPDDRTSFSGAYIYDVDSDEYSKMASPPGRAGLGAISVLADDRICLFGGNNSTANYQFDLKSLTWEQRKPIPNGGFVSGPCAVFDLNHDKLIHIFGSGSNNNGLHYEYDPVKDEWNTTPGAPPPFPVWFSALGVSSDNSVVLLGGAHPTTPQTAVVYDPISNKWSKGSTSWPKDPNLGTSALVYGTPRENPVRGDNLYVVSGQMPPHVKDGYYSASIWIYDMRRDAFRVGKFSGKPRDGSWGTFLGNDLYVFGGRFTNTPPIPGCACVDRLNLKEMEEENLTTPC